jgi:CubicO group peptidase (beta-lactamase class C family)
VTRTVRSAQAKLDAQDSPTNLTVQTFSLTAGGIAGLNTQPAVPQDTPPDWLAQATVKQADIGEEGFGYGFQWWTWDDGSFQADGIFGQGIFIDPKRKLVIASNANWTTALGLKDGEWPARASFYRAVQQAVDAEE